MMDLTYAELIKIRERAEAHSYKFRMQGNQVVAVRMADLADAADAVARSIAK